MAGPVVVGSSWNAMDVIKILGWLVLAIFMVLYHPGLPFAFHVRTYWIIGTELLSPRPIKRVDDEMVLRERVWLSAMDFNFHQNNAVYNTLLDFARIHLYLRLHAKPWDLTKIKVANGGVNIFFIKELRFMQPFKVRSWICDFDRKWLYFAHFFESSDGKTVYAVAVTRVVLKHRSGKTIVPREFFQGQKVEIPEYMQKSDAGVAMAEQESCKIGTTLQTLLDELQTRRSLKVSKQA